MFKNLFSFEGRIRRTEYGLTVLIYSLMLLFIGKESNDNKVLSILYIPLIYFIYSQGAKRCHDKGRNGWHQLIPFYIILLIFSEGDEGQNKYGVNPKNK